MPCKLILWPLIVLSGIDAVFKKFYKHRTLMWYEGNCLYEQPVLYVQRDGNYNVILCRPSFLKKTWAVICL
jgi:hypothetical protein